MAATAGSMNAISRAACARAKNAETPGIRACVLTAPEGAHVSSNLESNEPGAVDAVAAPGPWELVGAEARDDFFTRLLHKLYETPRFRTRTQRRRGAAHAITAAREPPPAGQTPRNAAGDAEAPPRDRRGGPRAGESPAAKVRKDGGIRAKSRLKAAVAARWATPGRTLLPNPYANNPQPPRPSALFQIVAASTAFRNAAMGLRLHLPERHRQ
jgi:hypothetical protein